MILFLDESNSAYRIITCSVDIPFFAFHTLVFAMYPSTHFLRISISTFLFLTNRCVFTLHLTRKPIVIRQLTMYIRECDRRTLVGVGFGVKSFRFRFFLTGVLSIGSGIRSLASSSESTVSS